MATKTAVAPTEIPTSTSIQTGFELETPKGVTTIADDVVAKLAGPACRSWAQVS